MYLVDSRQAVCRGHGITSLLPRMFDADDLLPPCTAALLAPCRCRCNEGIRPKAMLPSRLCSRSVRAVFREFDERWKQQQ